MANPFSNSDGPFQNSTPTDSAVTPKTSTTPHSSSTDTPAPSVGDIFAANAAFSGVPRPTSADGESSGTDDSIKLPKVPKYKPSGRIGPATWPLTVLLLPLVAGAVGYIHQAVTHGGGALLLTQLAMGLACGGGMCGAIRLGKCRNVGVAATAGILATVLAYIVSFAVLIETDRQALIDGMAPGIAKSRKMSLPQAKQAIGAKISYMVFAPVWIETRAAYGVSLRSTRSSTINGSSSGGTSFSGNGYYIFEVLKIGVAALIAACLCGTVAGARFSEPHNAWYQTKTLYNVDPSGMYNIVNAAVQNDWRNLVQVGNASKLKKNIIGGTVNLLQVPGQPEGILQVRRSTGQNQHIIIFEKEVSAEEVKVLRS